MQIASDTPQDKNLYKTDNALSKYNILQLSSELYFTVVKILKFPMCQPLCSVSGLIGALVHVCVVIVFLASLQRVHYLEKIHDSKDGRTDGQRTTNEENDASQLHFSIYILNPHRLVIPSSSLWSSSISAPNSSLDHSSATELVLSLLCQINGFATLYKGVAVVELGWRG